MQRCFCAAARLYSGRKTSKRKGTIMPNQKYKTMTSETCPMVKSGVERLENLVTAEPSIQNFYRMRCKNYSIIGTDGIRAAVIGNHASAAKFSMFTALYLQQTRRQSPPIQGFGINPNLPVYISDCPTPFFPQGPIIPCHSKIQCAVSDAFYRYRANYIWHQRWRGPVQRDQGTP